MTNRQIAQTVKLLFWLTIASLLLSALGPLGWILSSVQAYLLFSLHQAEPRFRVAGILRLVALMAGILLPDFSGWVLKLLRTILMEGLNLAWAYLAFSAFATLSKEIDPELSGKWIGVRNLYLIVHIATTIGIEIFSAIPLLSSVILLVAAIVSFVAEALILISYWKTHKAFLSQLDEE